MISLSPYLPLTNVSLRYAVFVGRCRTEDMDHLISTSGSSDEHLRQYVM